MKTSQAIHLPASVISTNRNKIIRIDPIKVEYFRIFIRRTESPLMFWIETRNPESLTICTSFSNPTPDIDDNNGVYSSGKVKIKVWLLILLGNNTELIGEEWPTIISWWISLPFIIELKVIFNNLIKIIVILGYL